VHRKPKPKPKLKLVEYQKKRKFGAAGTPEPEGGAGAFIGNQFVVQKHAATRLHYDLRLEMEGVLRSWAVPKGPSLNPDDKRLAVRTEDHPIEYGRFEGSIPEGHYGAGTVMVWDRGTYEVIGDLDAPSQVARGEIKFNLLGEKLRGSFVLVKLKHSEKGNEWLLIKHKDAAVDKKWNIDERDGSVMTGRTIEEIRDSLEPRRSPAPLAPQEVTRARKAAMPDKLEPMLAMSMEQPFSDREWLYEIKWDGVRAVAFLRDGALMLRARSGRDITKQYPEVAPLAAQLHTRRAIVDGEVVVLDSRGRGDFEALQERMHNSSPTPALMAKAPVIFYVFDLLYADGWDLRGAPLSERKALLRRLLDPTPALRFCDHQEEHGKELFELAREQGLEGIVAKRADSPYVSGRSWHWVKLKARLELDAVVCGWTAPRASRQHFGALLLGQYGDGALKFIGHVGTGFDARTLKSIRAQLDKTAVKKCPFQTVPETNEESFWVKPQLVARVTYAGWTNEGRPRHPSFTGLRDDISPEDCVLEAPPAAGASVAPAKDFVTAPAIVGTVISKRAEIEAELFNGREDNVTIELDGKRVRLANLNKVYFPESGFTKRHLLAHYYRVADFILPFLRQRPMVLRRYPDGIDGQSFFQKNVGDVMPQWMDTVQIASEHRGENVRYVLCGDVASLLYLTNLGCIDHNPWSSPADDLEHPDYFFFDLDPSDDTEFSVVMTIAKALYDVLKELDVRVYLKTSGATGFHMFVPVERGYTYDQLRMFAEIVARLVTSQHPKLITQERTVSRRLPGRVLIDVSQNAYGRPLAAAYSVRAFPGAPVSTPVHPRELRTSLRPEKFTLKSIAARIEKEGDLWAGFFDKRQCLDEAIAALSSRVPK